MFNVLTHNKDVTHKRLSNALLYDFHFYVGVEDIYMNAAHFSSNNIIEVIEDMIHPMIEDEENNAFEDYNYTHEVPFVDLPEDVFEEVVEDIHEECANEIYSKHDLLLEVLQYFRMTHKDEVEETYLLPYKTEAW